MATVPELHLFSDTCFKRSFSTNKSKNSSLAYTNSTSFSKQFNRSFGRDFYFEEAAKFLQRKKSILQLAYKNNQMNKNWKNQEQRKNNKKVQFNLEQQQSNQQDNYHNQEQQKPTSRFYSIQKSGKQNMCQNVTKVTSQPIFQNINSLGQKCIKVVSNPVPLNFSNQIATNFVPFPQGSKMQSNIKFVPPQQMFHIVSNGIPNSRSNGSSNGHSTQYVNGYPSNAQLPNTNIPNTNTKVSNSNYPINSQQSVNSAPTFHSFGNIPFQNGSPNDPEQTKESIQKTFMFTQAQLSKKAFEQKIKTKLQQLPKFVDILQSQGDSKFIMLEQLITIKKESVQLGHDLLKQLDKIVNNYEGVNQNKHFSDKLGKIIKEQQ